MTPLDPSAVAKAATGLREAERIVVFTGAGMSADSGVPTFRDVGGLWQEFPPEQFATWSGILKAAVSQPQRLARFVAALIGPIAAARPHAGHFGVAKLEQRARVDVVTQNIDFLHQEAGSHHVWEIHGNLGRIVGPGRRPIRQLSRAELKRIADALHAAAQGRVSRLQLARIVRPLAGFGTDGVYFPDLVLFGDMLAEPDWTHALHAVQQGNVLLEIGCSREVYPASTLPELAEAVHGRIISVSPEPQANGGIQLVGHAVDVVPELVEAALRRR